MSTADSARAVWIRRTDRPELPIIPSVVEFLGTYLLVLIGTAVAIANALFGPPGGIGLILAAVSIALAFGGALLTLALSVGRWGDGHFNPAVTVGAWVSGDLPLRTAGFYIGAQLLGGILAALTNWALFGDRAYTGGIALGTTLPQYGNGFTIVHAGVVEFLLTFVLVLAVVSNADRLHIAAFTGSTALFIGVLMAFPISGGQLNPARGIGPMLVANAGGPLAFTVYLLVPLLAGAAAGALSKFLEANRSSARNPA